MFSLRIDYSIRWKMPFIKKRWFREGKLHRLKGPSYISNYTKEWHICGTRHRENGPALEHSNGGKEWWIFGFKFIIKQTDFNIETYKKIGKEKVLSSMGDEPAVVWKNGTKEWYFDGLLHRFEKPAIEYANGDKEYWYIGQRLRRDGPAVIYGNKQYWFEYGFVKLEVLE